MAGLPANSVVCSTGYPAPCDSVLNQYCCSKPHPLTNEALNQCCGVLKSSKVCLSAASTIGVVGGYVSLWYSLCQAFFSLAAFIQLRRAAKSGGADTVKDKGGGEGERIAETTVGKDYEPLPDWRSEFLTMRKDMGTLTARFDRQAAEREEERKKAQKEATSEHREAKGIKKPAPQSNSLVWAIESVGIKL